ncbi:hypothetical protein APP86_00550 [Salmonella enterica subsp. houtenae]|nr:hypothetical protein [Salmonella enterica]OIV04445.1 hypothetical protein APP86_00550 [Salmonella enterica subsp. houtenae]
MFIFPAFNFMLPWLFEKNVKGISLSLQYYWSGAIDNNMLLFYSLAQHGFNIIQCHQGCGERSLI